MRGTQAHGAAEFARRVESLAADVDSFAGRSSCGVTLDCPSESFEDVLALFADALLTPAFGEEEIERERRDTLAALARREDRLGVARLRPVRERALGAAPVPFADFQGTTETVTRFEREELLAHHERLVRADNLVIAVVGDVDPDAAAALVQRRFADLVGGSEVEASLPPAGARAARVA